MCCTFGDLTDVQWWRELQLPTRSVLTRDGRLTRETPDWITSAAGTAVFVQLAGKTNFSERGDKPLEIVTSRQWYIRNGGRDAELRDTLLARGDELNFHPDFMRVRYQNWVGGLNGDWLVSRQRFFLSLIHI